MKRLISVFICALAAGVFCAVLGHAAASYNDTVSGFQSAAGENDGSAIIMNATGDLPGMFNLKLKHEGTRITGGEWSLTVLPPNPDATSVERGKLTGSVTGGDLTLGENGVLNAAASVTLTVQSGTGEYEAVTTGSGTLNLQSGIENPSQLDGPLAFNF